MEGAAAAEATAKCHSMQGRTAQAINFLQTVIDAAYSNADLILVGFTNLFIFLQ